MQDERPPSSDALRAGIDRGAGGDKAAAVDPAAAPLGTDDEAAGFPPTPEQRQMAAAEELRQPPEPQANALRREAQVLMPRPWGMAVAAGGVALVIVLLLIFL